MRFNLYVDQWVYKSSQKLKNHMNNRNLLKHLYNIFKVKIKSLSLLKIHIRIDSKCR